MIYAHSVPCSLSTQLKIEDQCYQNKTYRTLQKQTSLLSVVMLPTLHEVQFNITYKSMTMHLKTNKYLKTICNN